MSTRSTTEMHWVGRYTLFKSRGYALRPRLDPDWVPSWVADPCINPAYAEDYYPIRMWRQLHVMDGRRISDGKHIMFKKVKTSSSELEIATYFSSESLRKDPSNHCVPILDVIVDEENPSWCYMVMPFLRHIDKPEFDTIGSILDAVGQLLQGLVFMHSHNIAHRDDMYDSLRFEAPTMFPNSSHPFSDKYPRVPRTDRWSRRSKADVTYHFIDFSTSIRVPQVSKRSESIPHDPFKEGIIVDVSQ
ncbi:uncharacterized protein BXZ73DRAFT_73176 [Epithele typhae]|uniref:uncharacterized protein n=1 Tax=Epithele typhae TaxID=378194 RepID=UPI002007F642|nr:uncharacterized protein BXZ73DRAFT_73176 [Epithele typhae]KAH9946418.1 hypothetical protein BXZ73DRAFT_73176 [Epithele typhae]